MVAEPLAVASGLRIQQQSCTGVEEEVFLRDSVPTLSMKRCPQCRRRFSDESLNFCLDDGSPLLAEPDSEQTLIAPRIAASSGSPHFKSISNQDTAIKSSPRWILFVFIVLLAVMLGGAAVALLYRINQWDSRTNEQATPNTKPSKTTPSKSSMPTPEPSAQPRPSLSGEWSMVNAIEKTSYPAYANLRLGYHLVINQTGSEFTGEGEKLTENGRQMADYERTPIRVNGSISGNSVSATFVEEGLRRTTTGRFEWNLTADDQLRGTFVSTAAKSSGSSVVTRQR